MTEFNELITQAKQMQEKLQEAQNQAAAATVEGSAGAGLVKITMNGKHEVLGVELDPSLLREDKAVIEDLIAACMNDAARKIDKISSESLGGIAGGFKLPEGFKLPF